MRRALPQSPRPPLLLLQGECLLGNAVLQAQGTATKKASLAQGIAGFHHQTCPNCTLTLLLPLLLLLRLPPPLLLPKESALPRWPKSSPLPPKWSTAKFLLRCPPHTCQTCCLSHNSATAQIRPAGHTDFSLQRNSVWMQDQVLDCCLQQSQFRFVVIQFP